MTNSILVAYASRHGSTQEVAEAVAATLREHRLSTTVKPAADVDDVARYDGVVLGAALYMGRTHPDARHFLKMHRRQLEEIPVAVFAMGPLTLEDKAVRGSETQLRRALARVESIRPVATTVFGGVVDPDELHFPFTHMPAGDARDWEAIRAWAAEVADALRAQPVSV
jgi:menaquinone-dependent protoporphyrinogen oxidase